MCVIEVWIWERERQSKWTWALFSPFNTILLFNSLHVVVIAAKSASVVTQHVMEDKENEAFRHQCCKCKFHAVFTSDQRASIGRERCCKSVCSLTDANIKAPLTWVYSIPAIQYLYRTGRKPYYVKSPQKSFLFMPTTAPLAMMGWDDGTLFLTIFIFRVMASTSKVLKYRVVSISGPAEQVRQTRQLPDQYFRRILLLFIFINT